MASGPVALRRARCGFACGKWQALPFSRTRRIWFSVQKQPPPMDGRRAFDRPRAVQKEPFSTDGRVMGPAIKIWAKLRAISLLLAPFALNLISIFAMWTLSTQIVPKLVTFIWGKCGTSPSPHVNVRISSKGEVFHEHFS